ncbi:hypothetical protein FAI41_07790 [Acetobacteraceae bacterium]|nr:hypothetical protein FAI41_07790 [Acetobacteraceae bacterium]
MTEYSDFSQIEADIFYKNVLYDKTSKDLFDTPILSITDEINFIFLFAVKYTDIFQAIRSNFSRIAKNIKYQKPFKNLKERIHALEFFDKGKMFEENVYNVLKEQESKHDHFEVIKGTFKSPETRQQCEYDALVLWDEILFIFECKAELFSLYALEGMKGEKVRHTNPCGNNSKTRGHVQQANRLKVEVEKIIGSEKADKYNNLSGNPLVAFLKENREKIKEIIPVILYSMPMWYYPDSGVYTYDFSLLSRFFTGPRCITGHSLAFKGEANTKISKETEYVLWKEESSTSEDFKKQLKYPVQVERAKERISLDYAPIFLSENLKVRHWLYYRSKGLAEEIKFQ